MDPLELPNLGCKRCGKQRCKRFLEIPVGSPVKFRVKLCSKCLVYDVDRTKAWLKKLEEEWDAARERKAGGGALPGAQARAPGG